MDFIYPLLTYIFNYICYDILYLVSCVQFQNILTWSSVDFFSQPQPTGGYQNHCVNTAAKHSTCPCTKYKIICFIRSTICLMFELIIRAKTVSSSQPFIYCSYNLLWARVRVRSTSPPLQAYNSSRGTEAGCEPRSRLTLGLIDVCPVNPW